MIKKATGNGDWMVFDAMRGVVSDPYPNLDNTLFWNLSNAERTNTGYIGFTPTGFIHQGGSGDTNTNHETYIYLAVRRGSLFPPEAGDATKVFHIKSQSNADSYAVGFPTDLILLNKTGGSSANSYVASRLTGNDKYLITSSTAAEGTSSGLWSFDGAPTQNDFDQGASTSSAWVGWHWKRAPSYFDVVAYTGTGSARTVPHGLTVPPEMIWVKRRNTTNNWKTFHSSLGGTKSMELNTTVAAETNGSALWNSTAPTASVFSLGTASDVNGSGSTYIAYLFATLAGVSKVGSYTGNGSSSGPTVDCGFSGSPRFVLIKKATGGTGSWYVFDSARGIVAGAESQLYLNSTAAEQTATDQIDPTSSGFQIVINSGGLNTNGETYIFYAIA